MNAAGHLDYILFVEGFSLVIFAVMAWRLPDKEPGDLPWHCLTWFGLLHGMYEWLHMCTVGLGESDVFAVFRFAVMAASFLPLAEFGRQPLENGQNACRPMGVPAVLYSRRLRGDPRVGRRKRRLAICPCPAGSALAGWIILVDPHGRRDGRARKIIGFAFLAYDRPGDEKARSQMRTTTDCTGGWPRRPGNLCLGFAAV